MPVVEKSNPSRRKISPVAETRKRLKNTVGSVLVLNKEVEITLEDLKRMGRSAMLDSVTELNKIINKDEVTKHTTIDGNGKEVVIAVHSNLPIKIAAINSNTNLNRLFMDMDERENGKGKGGTTLVFEEANTIARDGSSTTTKSVTVTKKDAIVPEEVIQEYQDAALGYMDGETDLTDDYELEE